MNSNISDIYNLIQELSWYFGNQGFDGECCGDLSLVEYMAVKKVFSAEEITIQEIGDALNVTKSGASKIIDRVESEGYVLRKRSPVDGRVCCVAITDKGVEVIKRIEEQYTDYVGKMLNDYETDTVADIKRTMETLVTSVRKHGFINQIKKE